jgi:excisionase family DNA binding protein
VSLITPEAAANILGIKRQTLYLWAREGRVPYYRLGKRLIKFDREELLEWFRVERSSDCHETEKVEASAPHPSGKRLRLSEKDSPEIQTRRERYKAMLGMVE